ncbi:MAG: tRNA-dihydrouridine synthase, partial [Myxococcota bacterium]
MTSSPISTTLDRSKPAPLGPRGLPTWYAVRDVRITPNVVLAPMEGVTDRVFRRLIRGLGGPGLTYTEFIASKGLSSGGRREWRMAEFDPDERPIALQIYGRDPNTMAEAARLLEDKGATILDINMGCPSKKVCKNSGGSALMSEPELAVDIVRAVRKAIDIPLTVKMRSGFDPTLRNAPELAWRLQEEGAEAITIHWRTRADLYGGERAVDKIAEAVDRLSVPVIGNGDIVDIPSAQAMFKDTGCAGIMIGRGAIRNPWLMLQVGQWLRGEPMIQVTAMERRRILLRYYDTIAEFIPNPRGALGRMKMVTKHFVRDLPQGPIARAHILRAQEPSQAHALVDAYFHRLARYEAGDTE